MLSLSTLRNIKVIGHRGACGYAPENTRSSFLKALLCGVHWIEFDVMLAACGTPIIFHDETLDRTTNGKGDVGSYSYTELKQLDAGSWFDPQYQTETIPALESMIAEFIKTPLCFNVEIKPLPGQDDTTAAHALSVLSPYLQEFNHRFLFSSFSVTALTCLRELNQNLNLGLLLHDYAEDFIKICRDLSCVSLHVNHELLTAESIAAFKSDQYALFSYTVNQETLANQLYNQGVDAIFSDYPDKMINY